MIDSHQISPAEPQTTKQSRSVPTGLDENLEVAQLLSKSVHFYAAHLPGFSPGRSPSSAHEASPDRDTMLNEAAHILASSGFKGYDARHMDNPHLIHLMDSGRFETTEIRQRALSLGLLKPVIHNYPEQVTDTAATTEPMFRQLREWLKRMGHGSH